MKRLLQDKRKRIYIAELLVLLVLVICGLTRREQCVLETGRVRQEGTWTSEPFSAAPGVYRVSLEAELPEGSGIQISVGASSDTVFRALLQNGVSLQSGEEYTDYEFYVTDSIEELRLRVAQEGGGEPALLTRVAVYRTNKLWAVLAVSCLLLFTGGNLLLHFYRLVKEKKITAAQQAVVWVLLGGVLLSCGPYLTDYIGVNTDITLQLLRIEGLKEALLQGKFLPVRVQSVRLSEQGWGTWSFFGDLFAYPAAVLRICGFPAMTAYRLSVFALNAAAALIAYLCFRRCTRSRCAALFGALLYVLSPHRLKALYLDGAVGECLGLAFLPLIFCGLYLLLRGDEGETRYRHCKYYLAAGFTLLLRSHLFLTALALCGTLLLCLICARRSFRKRTLLQLAQGAGLTLLLNGLFLWSLLRRAVTGGYLFYGSGAGYIRSGMAGTVSALCVFGSCFLVLRLREDRLRKRAVLFVSILALGGAVYQVNDIVYNLPPTYLYTAQSLGQLEIIGREETLPQEETAGVQASGAGEVFGNAGDIQIGVSQP